MSGAGVCCDLVRVDLWNDKDVAQTLQILNITWFAKNSFSEIRLLVINPNV
jgi:hypothetical protein